MIFSNFTLQIFVNVCVYVCTFVRMYVCMYVCMYECVYVCLYVRMYVCVCACMCVCMYIFRENLIKLHNQLASSIKLLSYFRFSLSESFDLVWFAPNDASRNCQDTHCVKNTAGTVWITFLVI